MQQLQFVLRSQLRGAQQLLKNRQFCCLCSGTYPTTTTNYKVGHPTQRFASQDVAASASQNTNFFASCYESLSQSTPVHYLQESLLHIHDYTGLPWWATITLTTLLYRTVITLPFAIYQQKIIFRLSKISEEMQHIAKELAKETAMAKHKFQWNEQHTKYMFRHSIKKQWTKLIVRDNCHPAKTLLTLWLQIPLWIGQSVALRNLVHMLPNASAIEAQIAYAELCVGGIGWFPNLTEVDSSYILPIALGIINLAIIELQPATHPSKRLKFSKYIFRTLSVAMVPIAATVPSAVCLYWVTSSSFALLQNLALQAPTVRSTLGLPAQIAHKQLPGSDSFTPK